MKKPAETVRLNLTPEPLASGGSERVHVFLGFMPFHLLVLQQLVARERSGRSYLFHPEIARGLRPGWLGQQITLLGLPSVASAPRKMHYLLAALQLRSILLGKAAVEVYLPHPYNPLANFVFFSSRVSARHIYEDGVLNYYDAEVGKAHPRHRLRQMLRAALLGLPYRSYEGHIAGMDAAPVECGYFTRPANIVGKARFRTLCHIDLPTPRRTLEEIDPEPLTLFLDQPIESEMSRQRATALRSQAADFCEQLALPVLYKPHPAQGAARTRLAGWRTLSGPESTSAAESIVAAHNIVNVVGFFSSALVNIALAHRHIRCFALGCEAMPILADGARITLADVFRAAGVITID